MEGAGPAMMIATEEDTMSHGHVLYGLVKPSKEAQGVESTYAMVNVVPRKRIYRMETIDELDLFKNELLQRPLVIQPEVVSGTGSRYLKRLNVDCGICVQRESWVIMINQIHPKVMGRIQMGVDIAKKTMKEGEPFVLEFNFSDVLKRLYHDIVVDLSPKNSSRVYADCEFGDLIVRYPGDEAHQSMMWSMKARHFCFAFEDLTTDDVILRTREKASREQTSPVIVCRTHEELKVMLPEWVFLTDEVTEQREASDYGYDQNILREEATAQPSRPARVKGRSQRAAANKYDVPVELHVPVTETNIGQHVSEEDGYEPMSFPSKYSNYHNYGQTNIQNSHHHTKQGSGSGRSAGSSAADSGYDGHIDSSHKQHFDNPAYDNEPSANDILQKHKALAAKMLQQNEISESERTFSNNYRSPEQEMGQTYTAGRPDDSDNGFSVDYNSPKYRSRSNEMGESFI